MSEELIGVLIGGVIGILGGLATTMYLTVLTNRRRARSIRSIAVAEIIAISRKVQRFLDGQSSPDGLSASTPMLTSISSELGFLTLREAILFRHVVTLDMEVRKERTTAKAEMVVETAEAAILEFGAHKYLGLTAEAEIG